MADFGLSLAAGLASNFLIGLITPTRKVENEPRDVRGPKASFDQPIPVIYGRSRVSGGYLWAPKVRVEKSQERRGGKGGGGGASVTTYAYYASFAVWFCAGVAKIRKIWMNGQLFYVEGGNANISVTLYQGTETQVADSAIQSVEGVNETPAFRGVCYCVVEDLDLEPIGGAFPSVIDAEIESLDFPYRPSLQSVIEDVCLRGGVSVNASALSDISLYGCVFKRDGGSYREFLEELQKLYFFLPIYENGEIRFIKQSQVKIYDISIKDLFLNGYKQVKSFEKEIPYEVQVIYSNLDDSYQKGIQYARKNGQRDNTFRLETRTVLKDTIASTIAQQLLTQFWLQRIQYEEIKLLSSWLGLSPGHVIGLPVANNIVSVQIKSIDIGADLSLEIKANLYEGASLTIGGDKVAIENDYDYTPSPEPTNPGEATIYPFEAPLRNTSDSEVGIYATIEAGQDWRQGGIFLSVGDNSNYQQVAFIDAISTAGTCSNDISADILPNQWDGSPIVDTSTIINLTLTAGSIASIPESRFNRNENLILIGDEYIAFRDATLISEGQYELSYLRRGLRGTERAIAQHTTNEKAIVVINEGTIPPLRLSGIVEEIGQQLFLKVVHAGQSVDEVTAEATITPEGISLKPFAPVAIKAQSVSGGIKLSWEARSRGAVYSLGEDDEAYEVDIYRNGSPIRTLQTSQPEVLYETWQQNGDFGQLVSEIEKVAIYKISSIVGRGFPAIAENIKLTFVEITNGGITISSNLINETLAEESSGGIVVGSTSESISKITSSGGISVANTGFAIAVVIEESSGGITISGESADSVVLILNEASNDVYFENDTVIQN